MTDDERPPAATGRWSLATRSFEAPDGPRSARLHPDRRRRRPDAGGTGSPYRVRAGRDWNLFRVHRRRALVHVRVDGDCRHGAPEPVRGRPAPRGVSVLPVALLPDGPQTDPGVAAGRYGRRDGRE